mgnify:CR=1 FL=1
MNTQDKDFLDRGGAQELVEFCGHRTANVLQDYYRPTQATKNDERVNDDRE